MSAQRLVGLALVVCSAACAPRSGNQAVRPIAPQDGPGGSLHVRYTGGLIYRTVDATFRVDENAYVLVGHLAGDGVIRVIHPASPVQAMRYVRAGQSVATGSFTAAYDGAPSAFSLMSAPFRNTSAMMDSYDGLGHGFVFMILTRTPMDVGAISDGFEWAEMDVLGYLQTSDPRRAIRDFAEQITRGDNYTIKFAHSFTTQNFASYASTAFDCGTLSSLGFGHLPTFWGSWGLSDFSYLGFGTSRYGMGSGCGGQRYAYNDYAMRRQYVYVPYIPYGPVAGGPRAPTGPITPTLTRPTKRALGEAGPGVRVGRSALDRRTPSTFSSRASEYRRRASTADSDDAIERASARASRSRPASEDANRAARPREAAPRAEQPRAATPRSDDRRPGGASPKADAPRATPAPQRSNPPAAAPTKQTGTETKTKQ